MVVKTAKTCRAKQTHMSIIKRAFNHVRKLKPGSLLKKILRPRGVFQERYSLESSPRVTLYTNTPEQFPGYQEIRPLHQPATD